MTIEQILQLANAGIIPILLFVWWDTRQQNAKLQERLNGITDQILEMLRKTEKFERLLFDDIPHVDGEIKQK